MVFNVGNLFIYSRYSRTLTESDIFLDVEDTVSLEGIDLGALSLKCLRAGNGDVSDDNMLGQVSEKREYFSTNLM